MEIQWKEIKFEDKEIIEEYYSFKRTRSCEFSFANNLLWSPHYKTKWSIVGDCLVFYDEAEQTVCYPIGADEYEAIRVLKQWFKERHRNFCMHLVTAEQFEQLNRDFEGEYKIEYERDAADYIYESERLISLSGKKLHAKRNHIHRFEETYPDWSYERLTRENEEECLAMAQKWRIENLCEEDEEKSAEFCVTLNAIRRREALNLVGGLLRAGGEIVAFSIGEPLTNDTFVVHIEKAFADVQGAYPMINREFVKNEAANFKYINREDDVGQEGLRKAKLSYEPCILLEKGIVTTTSK